ncbi:MAG TPA: hypothetical protein VG245_01070, partial [Candidatus Dormibacteraeota bacterium]|nr:hypothetical protein [Candidatus Dormibacteraeota bacterium]
LLVEQFVHMALENTARAYVLTKGEVVSSGPSKAMLDDPSLVESYLGGHSTDPHGQKSEVYPLGV